MLLLVLPVYAYSTGIYAHTSGCIPCHGPSATASTTATFSTAVTTVAPGDTIAIALTVASSLSTQTAGGLDVSASAGTLTAGSTTQLYGGDLTHIHDVHFSSGAATFAFSWTAPATEGTVTLSGAALAINDDHSPNGDYWNLASDLTITVDDGCDDGDGDGFEACDDGTGDDCDDTDATIAPGADETCDGVDQDCDGTVDETPTDGDPYWPDTDGDGFGDASASGVLSCTTVSGSVANATDCDDGDATVSPAGTETCDGVDDDCDGTTDEPDASDAATWYRDADSDTFGDATDTAPGCAAPLGYVAAATDCDDTRPTVNPDATEVCDPLDLDEDCDGLADDADPGVTGTTPFYADADADTYGATGTSSAACTAPAGYVPNGGDCDDTSSAYNPGADEACDEDVDYNCDGSTGYADGDGDGIAACEDCDDGDAAVLPGATETCNTVDDDCDGTVDEPDAADADVWFVDADADGYGSPADAQLACTQPAGYAATATDCDDADASVRPDAPEVWYDGIDQDCSGGGDDDQDGDGFALAGDCDDLDPTVFPGAVDTWYDGVDADCSGGNDYDADGDGHDAAGSGGDDCDDGDATVYPGAPDEPYDGVVNDCANADDDDFDGDGYDRGEDCDDTNSDVHPGATETWYDGRDADCSGGGDDDQDGDGVTVAVDCDDTDPAVLVDCPDTAADSGDTAPTGDDTAPATDDTGAPQTDDGCGGCASGHGASWLGLLAAGLMRRRR